MVVCPADIEAEWPVRIRVDGTTMQSGDLATRNLTDWLEHTIDVDLTPGHGSSTSGGLVNGFFLYRGPGENACYTHREVDFEW
eukprot:6305908-Prymnesium_polylepis.1